MKHIARFFAVLTLAVAPALAFAVNQPPVPDAGRDRNAYTGLGITLEGSATSNVF
jgi:hypothetical protein